MLAGTISSTFAFVDAVTIGRIEMKKMVIIATALTLALSTAAFAQATGAGTAGQGAGSASGDNNSPGSPQSNNPTGNQERK
jgi:hypothetical protein